LASILLGILLYDYWNILRQVYENKHLNMENRQLREQIQLFQMKINSLADDLHRINTFERKLRIITGLEDITIQPPLMPDTKDGSYEMMDDHNSEGAKRVPKSTNVPTQNEDEGRQVLFDDTKMETDKVYIELKSLYDKKIAANLGITSSYTFTRKWSDLAKKSFALSEEYSRFDYKFKTIKNEVKDLEIKIHALDQHLLDKESILMSTPTILPANGWITSYFGHRISPYSGGLKMHEGLDVGAPYGTPIVAPADGIVTFSGIKAGFGKFVQIDHGYGIETIYAHSQKRLVKTGERVKRGDLIAKVGSTGYSTGPHLHYEVRVNGIAVDPLYFVLER
jgi:murein DD-endopeptidase MepM/ murein hydrolase activator NlpD